MSVKVEELLKVLDGGDYNAAPGVLRQGCMLAVRLDGEPLTEDDWDDMWISAVGNCNRYSDEPPCHEPAKCSVHRVVVQAP